MAAITTPMAPSNPIISQNGTQYLEAHTQLARFNYSTRFQLISSRRANFGYSPLDLSIQSGKNTPTTNYPVVLTLKQTGSAKIHITLRIQKIFNVDSASWHGSTK